MRFSLKSLLEGEECTPTPVADINISGVASHSRNVREGFAFFALPGSSVHGNCFISDAVRLGASVVVSDRGSDDAGSVPLVLVKDVRACFARAAGMISQPHPENIVAVTGTNGKTSVVSFVRQIWEMNDIRAASIGTLGVTLAGESTGGQMTTPEAMTLHKTLQALKSNNIDHVALEASSHGLDQRRLDGLRFKVVGFTNLSRDHLDYHQTMNAYRDAKLRLFRELALDRATCVVNMDSDEATPFMLAGLERQATVVTVGINGAYFEIGSIQSEGYGQRVTGHLVGEKAEFYLPLAGEFQVSNALVALAIAVATGVDKQDALDCLPRLKGAKGRLELVVEHRDAAVFVDYAHTPAALEAALQALRPIARGRIISVFGCGGDRDRGKRALMGKAALENSDVAILTDDNPRSEDPAAIRADVSAGRAGIVEISGRGDAIRQAVAMLQPGDILLVAGKGHENYQIIDREKHYFSDQETVLEAVKA